MALTGTGNILGDKIAEALTSPTAPPDAVQQIKQVWESIGTVIVEHIVTNAVVTFDPSTGEGNIS